MSEIMYFTNILKKNIVLTVSFVLFALAGCDEDLLTKVPTDRLSTETFWKTEEDATLAVNNLYNHLPGVYALIWDSMSDIAIPNNIFFPEAVFVRGVQDPQSSLSASTWNGGYGGIRASNEFLANVGKVENVDQDLIDRFRAEARTIRAFEYIQLVMIFGDVPLITTPISIEEGKTLERTNKEEIWNFIATELEESASDLPPIYTSLTDQGRITRGAALALKSRAMLYAGRYGEAHKAAKAVMNLGVYDIYPSYENLFTYAAENNQEVVLDRQYISNLKANDIFARFGMSALGQSPAIPSYPVPTKNIVAAYEMSNGMDIGESGSGYDPANPYANRDPRLGYSIFTLGDVLLDGEIYDPRSGGTNDINRGQATTNTGYDVKKYVNWEDRPQPYNSGINVILMRYAEVLLTYAEAKIEDGQIDQSVYDAINDVRERADVDMPRIEESGQTQSEMREIVRHERMVELAFEGQRFFDIRRWEIAEDVLNGPIEGETFVQDTYADRSDWQVVDVDSEDAAGGNVATNVFDSNVNTIWHTDWQSNPQPPHPHHITIDMGETNSIYGFRITGRQGFKRGNPRDILIEVSSDGINWENEESFTLANEDINTVNLSTPQEAQFFKLTVNASFEDINITHLAEIEASIDRSVQTVVYPDYERNFIAPKHYLWPIPEKEVELNSNIRQNPSY
jgi:hypothetical protein